MELWAEGGTSHIPKWLKGSVSAHAATQMGASLGQATKAVDAKQMCMMWAILQEGHVLCPSGWGLSLRKRNLSCNKWGSTGVTCCFRYAQEHGYADARATIIFSVGRHVIF